MYTINVCMRISMALTQNMSGQPVMFHHIKQGTNTTPRCLKIKVICLWARLRFTFGKQPSYSWHN